MQPDQGERGQVRRLFLVGLGGVFFCAFASAAIQIDGLIGPDGIMPATDFLDRAREYFGGVAPHRLPTVFWFGAGTFALHLVCGLGLFFSGLLISGFAPRLSIALLWTLYLSISSVGDVFFGYQWDALLIETAACAFFYAPDGWTPASTRQVPTNRLGLFLVRFLLARLMFLSGAVKWLSGDPAWRDGSALQFHFWSQPLPAIPAWWADRLPDVMLRSGVVATFLVELVLPIFVFAPRRFRLVAFVGFIGLQFVIASTGSYGFFNLLTCVLCLTLLEDRDLAIARRWLARTFRIRRETSGPASTEISASPASDEAPDTGSVIEPDEAAASAEMAWRMHLRRARRGVETTAAALLVFFATVTTLATLGLGQLVPEPIRVVQQNLMPLRSFNGYGLFAVMTTERIEIEVEGSLDGESWGSYVFPYKPGPPDRAPRFAMPHMPRLDWQMWFASLRGCDGSPWFHQFLFKLLQGSDPVGRLLETNPFPDEPPRYLRTPARRARFAGPGADDGSWWAYEAIGRFCPTVELRDGRLVAINVGSG